MSDAQPGDARARNAEAQARVIDFWNARATSWNERTPHGPDAECERAVWMAVLSEALPPPPADILDVGAGTGFLSLLATELGQHVTGIDLADKMVAAARKKCVGLSAPPVFLSGDAADLPLPAAGFDAIMSRHLLWMLPDPASACQLAPPAAAGWQAPGDRSPLALARRGRAGTNDASRTPHGAMGRALLWAIQSRPPLTQVHEIEQLVDVVQQAGFAQPRVAWLHEIHHLDQ